ncbi:MAG TPA: FAD-dependent oxidoreductase, partial [Gemmataceae bacterium]|nr:FAD-dependent oxidoreductase [Gemmataceae bacterium]
VVLDKRDVATGSTAASTSLLQHAADTDLVDLLEKVGEAAAVRSYKIGLESVAKLERLVGELGNACGFERKRSLYLASAKSHVAKLRQEYELRRRHGFEVEFLEQAELKATFSFTVPAAILANGDAQIDAFRFSHRLLEHAAKRGLRVFDRTDVKEVTPRRNGMALTTDQGNTVSARRVVFATGYESQRYLKQKIGDLHSTFALITEPLEEFPLWPDRCLIWETARPYCYLRATDDDRILIGGKDTPFATAHRQDGLVKKKTSQLLRRLQRMFPKTAFEIAYSWAGTFGTTPDGLAYIGVSSEWPNAYFALGYGGNGITMSVTAAELIVDHYLGRDNPDAKIFSFDR